MARSGDAAWAARAERFAAAASALLLVPDLTPTERDAVFNARKMVRRGLAMREQRATTGMQEPKS